MGIGVIESVLSRYIEDKGVLGWLVSDDNLFLGTFTSPSVYRSAAFLVIVVVLVVGGRALPLRSELLDRLPAVGTGRVHVVGVAIAVVAMAVVLMTVPDDWALALVISMATAIVCLSLVVVTGFVGQLSLAQMALAGFGAWVAGRLAAAHRWDFLPAMIVGALAVVPLGVLVALPALRTRGINLAVLTFGLAIVISEMVLGNSALTGGFEGTKPDPPTLFGLEIDAFFHPGRYGLVVLVVLTLLSLMVANLRRGRSGLRLLAVRSNERAAAALGVSVPGAKVYAFGVGCGDRRVRRDPPRVPFRDDLVPDVRWVRLDPGRRAVRHRGDRVRASGRCSPASWPRSGSAPDWWARSGWNSSSSTSSRARCSSSSCSPTRTASPTPTWRRCTRSRVVAAASHAPSGRGTTICTRKCHAVRVPRSTSST